MVLGYRHESIIWGIVLGLQQDQLTGACQNFGASSDLPFVKVDPMEPFNRAQGQEKPPTFFGRMPSKRRRFLGAGLSAVAISAYTLLVGGSAPVVRAAWLHPPPGLSLRLWLGVRAGHHSGGGSHGALARRRLVPEPGQPGDTGRILRALIQPDGLERATAIHVPVAGLPVMGLAQALRDSVIRLP
jgi:hypothetical protein